MKVKFRVRQLGGLVDTELVLEKGRPQFKSDLRHLVAVILGKSFNLICLNPLQMEMANHVSIFAKKTPWTVLACSGARSHKESDVTELLNSPNRI